MPRLVWPAMPSRDDANVFALLHQFEQSQWWEPERLQARQLQQIQQLVSHAAETVPFYRGQLKDVAGLTDGQLTMELFRQIPILTRTDVQDHGDALVTSLMPPGHGELSVVKTSGASGQPLTVQSTGLTRLFFRTLGLRYHIWHKRDFSGTNMTIRSARGRPSGQTQGSWVACYPSGPSWFVDVAQPAPDLFEWLMKVDPHYVQTMPGVVELLVQHGLDTGRRPKRLREFRTMGELLESGVRQLCRDTWDISVTDNYSAWEAGIIALQCPECDDLHVQSETVLVEVLDENGTPCGQGESGRVVVTVLHNFANPIIRYEIGDVAEVGGPCSCGRGLPVLKRVVGRVQQRFILPDGRKVIPNINSVRLLEIAPLRKFQAIQTTPGDLEIRLMARRELTPDEEQRLFDHFTDECSWPFNYTLKYVDEIPRKDSGKYEVYRSEVAE